MEPGFRNKLVAHSLPPTCKGERLSCSRSQLLGKQCKMNCSSKGELFAQTRHFPHANLCISSRSSGQCTLFCFPDSHRSAHIETCEQKTEHEPALLPQKSLIIKSIKKIQWEKRESAAPSLVANIYIKHTTRNNLTRNLLFYIGLKIKFIKVKTEKT